MEVVIKEDPVALGQAAGTLTADCIRKTIRQKGQANILPATGASQLDTLKQLVACIPQSRDSCYCFLKSSSAQV